MDTDDLTGRTVVVTGAASGIGREIALLAARRGADLALCDVDESGLEETAAHARRLGRGVLTRRVDVAERPTCPQRGADPQHAVVPRGDPEAGLAERFMAPGGGKPRTPAHCWGAGARQRTRSRAMPWASTTIARERSQHCAQLLEVKLAPPAGPLTSNDAPMGYLPVLTNLTHWPWFLNLVPKFFQPPFLH